MSIRLSHDEIVEKTAQLPAFPLVVTHILETIDDDNATLGDLVAHIERDPVITARVVALASSASMKGRHEVKLGDVYTATSLIGMSRLREVVIGTNLAEFARSARVSTFFWEHSVAVGVSAQELARHIGISMDYAFVAGLLHDIGQLWLARFYPQEFQLARKVAEAGIRAMVDAEKDQFGMDHCLLGRYIAECWGLPKPIIDAIYLHHHPDERHPDKLVAVTHVAEVIANALNLGHREGNQVTYLSPSACAMLHMDFTEDLQHMFGRMEARTNYACTIFRK